MGAVSRPRAWPGSDAARLGPRRGSPVREGRAGTILSEVVRTFYRLLGFLRPYRRGVFWSLCLAAGAIGGTVAIPWLTGRAIDQIKQGDRHGLVLVGVAVAGAGLAP